MITKPKLKITKLDAAKRQLEMAIRLYFNEADPVSIHTLASAAHIILSDLNKKCAGKPMIVSDFLVKDKFKKEIRKKINEAKNHFKHADKDPETTIDFRPGVNDFVLFDACEKYIELTSEKPPYFIIFRGWFSYKYPDSVIFPHGQNEQIKKNMTVFGDNKAEYFSAMLAVSGSIK